MSDSRQAIESIYGNVSFVDFVSRWQSLTGVRIGKEYELSRQNIRFRCVVDASFPSGEIARWTRPSSDSNCGILEVNFFGLFGPGGVLPEHYGDLIAKRIKQNDDALVRFLEIFNHRLLAMFYLVWEKHRFLRGLEGETIGKSAQGTTLSYAGRVAIVSVAGQRLFGAEVLSGIDQDCGTFYSGYFAKEQISVQGLRDALSDYLGLAVEIESFVGQWIRISPEDQSRIATQALGEDCGNRLGVNAIIGERAWDRQNRFRVIVGPVTWYLLERFFPEIVEATLQSCDRILGRVFSFVRRLVGPQWDFDVQILLESKEVKEIQLDQETQYRLGWNTWLGRPVREKIVDQVVFSQPVLCRGPFVRDLI
jgi:type VI secretion system protein ImpH